MKFVFQNPKFLKSAVKPEHFPDFGALPEIAVVGRSNVGKSTLLNHLFKSNLVKTSSTPGKTQAVNFFSLEDTLIFADLPGYGYAQVPFHERKNWGSLIESYLSVKPNLILFLLDIRRTPNADDMQMLAWIEASGIPAILVLTKVDKVKRGERARQTKNIVGMLDSIYSNSLKNREFGKAGAWSLIQQSGDEAAQLQQVGRCRRDQNPRCPAQPKTDSSSCLGINSLPYVHYSAVKNEGRNQLIRQICEVLN